MATIIMNSDSYRGIPGLRISAARMPIPDEEGNLLIMRTDHFEYRFHDPNFSWQGKRGTEQLNEYRRFHANEQSLHDFRKQVNRDFCTEYLQLPGSDQAVVALWKKQMNNLAGTATTMIRQMMAIEEEMRVALGLNEFCYLRRNIKFGNWIRSGEDLETKTAA